MKKIKIALINPPSSFLLSDTVMPPLGIMHLSSYIKSVFNDEIECKIIDLSSCTMEYQQLIKIPDDCHIYAFTSTTPQYNTVLKIMNEVKNKIKKDVKKNRNNEFINSMFIIGGAHATCFEEKCRDDGFDCVVIGEGEKSLESIVDFVKKTVENKDNSVLRGIIRSSDIQDIDSIPFPDRDFEGFNKYNYLLDGKKCTTMITSRGCNFKCSFCCKTWSSKVRFRSYINVLKEVEFIKNNYGISAIQFYDDTFTISKQRLLDICKGLKHLEVMWRCFVHTNTVTKEILSTMHDSGCVEVGMGVESGNQKILDTINKKIKVDDVIRVCNWCHEIGLRIKTFLIIGLPGESRESVDDTIKFLRKARPDDYDISIYNPFPKTDIWDNMREYDINFNKNSLDYSKMYYKGVVGNYVSQVSTSQLTSEEIEILRDYIDVDIRKELHG